ncbi:MAG: MFS transporter [Firmicutes bacterium]|nr:MFS transporter [Bacillota bacterium]
MSLFFIILSLGHLVIDLAPGALLIIMTYMKRIMSLNFTQTTLIFFTVEMTSSFLQPFFGMLIDKKRIPWLLPVAISLTIGTISFVSFITNYYLLLFLLFIAGIGLAIYHPQASKDTYLLSKGNWQASAMSLFSIGGIAGMGIAPVLVTWFFSLAEEKGTLFFLIPGALMLIILAFKVPGINRLAMANEEIHSAKVNRGSQRLDKASYKLILILLAFTILRSWIHAGIMNFIPLYFIDYLGESADYGSTLLTLFLISGSVGLLIAGPVADRFGLRKILLFSMLLCIPFTYLLFNTGGRWGLVFSILNGMAIVSTFGITVVYAQRILSTRIGLASALMLGVSSGLGAFGTVILGGIADRWNIFYSLRVISILPIIGLMLVLSLPEVEAQGESRSQEQGV